MNWDRRLKSGYSDLGPIRIPVLPQPIILTDRADGVTQWLVSWSDTTPPVDGNGRLSVNSDTNIERKIGVRVYTPYEGPVFGQDGEYVLFFRSGRLGIDYNPFAVGNRDRDDAPVYLRQKGIREIRQLVLTGTDRVATTRLTMVINEAQQDG